LKRFSELIHQIYASSTDSKRWHETVAVVGQAFRARQAVLFTPYISPVQGGLMFPWQVAEQDLVMYGTKYIDHDLWAQSAQRKGWVRGGMVALDEDLVPQDVLLDSVYFREFLSGMGIGRICSGVIFEGAPGLPATVLSVYRAPDDPFGPQERELMRLLVPHFSRAMGLMHRLCDARNQLESLRAGLNRLSIGVFLMDHTLRITYCNATGQRTLERRDGLALDASHRLTAAGRGIAARLEAWLTAQLALPAHARNERSNTFEVARTDPQQTYTVQWYAIADNDRLAQTESSNYIVFVNDPQKIDLPDSEYLQKHLGLTAAEARVALAMVRGGTYKEVALSLGVGEETVRTQIRSVYAKTRTLDKAGLTRLVLSLSKSGI
jgi:DNA-binding CsgD family transcriptional regulator/PAS domain-containing protein